MDVKVYKKEEVKQPSGTTYVITPNIIDIIPTLSDAGLQLTGCDIVSDNNDIIEQACAMATIWQKGQDPLDTAEGIRWSESMLGEINVVQLMEDLTNAVAEVTPTVEVVFDTVTDSNGNQYLKYTLQGVA